MWNAREGLCRSLLYVSKYQNEQIINFINICIIWDGNLANQLGVHGMKVFDEWTDEQTDGHMYCKHKVNLDFVVG